MDTLGVIFDMDGVLVDSYQAHFESWRLLGQQHGVDMTEQQFASCFGRTSRDIIRHFWGDHVDDPTTAAWDAEKEAAYRDILQAHFPEMDGASDLIRALSEEGFAMAIGSSGPAENVGTIENQFGDKEPPRGERESAVYVDTEARDCRFVAREDPRRIRKPLFQIVQNRGRIRQRLPAGDVIKQRHHALDATVPEMGNR